MFRAIIYKQSSTFNFIQFLYVQSIEGNKMNVININKKKNLNMNRDHL